MKRGGIVAFLGALSALVIACGGESDEPTDAGTRIDAPTEMIDAGTPDAGEPDGGCDVSPEPTELPDIAGGFAVADDGDGGSNVPVATGGDPTGTWVFDDATFYVSSTAAGMFDIETSTVTGSAWAAFDGTEARLDFEFVTTLEGTLAGTLVRPSSTQIRGSYVVEGTSIGITPTCAQSSAGGAGGGGSARGLAFSMDGDDGRLITTITGTAGEITIVLDGTRRGTP
ncbi:hypothetical protein [Sandaracinus amylolyticus]|uniref:hypothetical protein n=1 Tax=Sandaracinus amylolyticus TaxID=927083 RepID=UPI001F1E7C8D|nr:hypothetical protein [Sandaracinus amylolyticus]UJR79945.1 Hypothetical protein I5071_19850 [Sandaracinus amylolyticus]